MKIPWQYSSPCYHDAIRVERTPKKTQNMQGITQRLECCENTSDVETVDKNFQKLQVDDASLNKAYESEAKIEDAQSDKGTESLSNITNDENVTDDVVQHIEEITSNDKKPGEENHERSVVQSKQFLQPKNFSTSKSLSVHFSKKNTGLKNISHNVGMAVSPTNKMEFNQEEPESFGVVKINRPISKTAYQPSPHEYAASTAPSNGSNEGYTGQGYFDLKFYHNKLW